jgi:hypothetical protein
MATEAAVAAAPRVGIWLESDLIGVGLPVAGPLVCKKRQFPRCGIKHPWGNHEVSVKGRGALSSFGKTPYEIMLLQWGRPGFDVGREADRGMPRSSHLVNQLETIDANDERYALAA